ncbi:DNA circularization N-terminal domain-containing protein [Bradyrhizobium sp. S3.9.1]|uniref:DNA circularization N-terminal domain-containing protein n=1 Tax=Bradyrhizobium sp. S3.9.1 TaxID=3156431 RepID=UPI00339550C3
MVAIRDIHTPWRDRYQRSKFRTAIFYVDVDVRSGGRRVALHQYPKRNVPYAEDMGRSAIAFTVQGFLIALDGSYLDLKNDLIDALEQDGPGVLRLPLPYQMSDVQVMVQSYSISESRERGGMCTVEMSFVEYGDPSYRSTTSTPETINQSASKVESSVMGTPEPDTVQQAKPYTDVYNSAKVSDYVPNLTL